ncbi:MAG: hypothetical protein V4658_02730 [Bacteroidota bacterium]
MKKIMILSAFSLLMFDHSVFAKNNSVELNISEYIVSILDDNTKSPVKIEDLPEAVKKTLAADAYKGWAASEAFLVQGKAEYYEIIVKKEAEVKTLKLNKEGIVVE